MNYKKLEEIKKDADRCLKLILGVEGAIKGLMSACVLAKQRIGRLETKLDELKKEK